jgi:hypothetical protein
MTDIDTAAADPTVEDAVAAQDAAAETPDGTIAEAGAAQASAEAPPAETAETAEDGAAAPGQADAPAPPADTTEGAEGTAQSTPKRPRKSRKAAADKNAGADTPPVTPPAPAAPAVDDSADRPLTKDEKRALAAAVVTATAAALFGARTPAALKGLPRETAAQQVANWLAYLPAGEQWDERLPKPNNIRK